MAKRKSMTKKQKTTFKAWAIVPSFPNSEELEKFLFLDDDRYFLIFITKEWAEVNTHINEQIIPVEIKILV